MNQTSTSRAAKERFRNQFDHPAAKLNPFAPKGGTRGIKARRLGPPAQDEDLKQCRETLLALRARLKGDMARADDTLGNVMTESAAAPDSVDYAAEAVEQDVAVSLLGNATQTLGQIDGALERLEDGSYGRCADCDAPIAAARLEAIPYAARCVHCAAKQEQAADSPDVPARFGGRDEEGMPADE
jgi:DnaK suppressor protein